MQFLNKASLETMLGPQLPKDKDATNYVSLGFFCTKNDGHTIFRHGGWDEGFVAELILFTATGKGAVVMINSNEGHPLIAELVRAIGKEFDWPESPNSNAAVSLSDLSEYAGVFETEHSQQFRIRTVADGLQLEVDTQPPVNFEASSKTNFFSKSVNTTLAFEVNGDEVTALTVHQGGVAVSAKKHK